MRASSTRLPAHCANCGAVFLSNYGLGPSRGTTFRGNIAECPNCHHPAHVIDGTFNFIDNAFTALRAPPRTIEILEVLQEALKQIDRGKSAEEVIAEIEQAGGFGDQSGCCQKGNLLPRAAAPDAADPMLDFRKSQLESAC